MKKLLVLFVAVAATISSFAADVLYFNWEQFKFATGKTVLAADNQDVQLTVPLVYKGTVAFKSDWVLEPDAAEMETIAQRGAQVCYGNTKKTMPAVMTICQPCMDCHPCDVFDLQASNVPLTGLYDAAPAYSGIADEDNTYGDIGKITRWDLYLVVRTYKEDGLKFADIAKINLAANATESIFFTGSLKGNAYVWTSPAEGLTANLVGKKDTYKFNFYHRLMLEDGSWADLSGTKAVTAKITALKSLEGTVRYGKVGGFTGATKEDQIAIADIAGTLKLTRDASWTGKAVKGAFGAPKGAKSTVWPDACEPPASAKSCEEYFAGETFQNAYFGAAYKNHILNFANDADAFAGIENDFVGILPELINEDALAIIAEELP